MRDRGRWREEGGRERLRDKDKEVERETGCVFLCVCA